MKAEPKQRLVIVGAGMAGSKLASAVLALPDQPYEVILISEEAQAGYNRIMLSSLLANEISAADMSLVDLQAMQKAGLELQLGNAVISIDKQAKSICLSKGQCFSYDKLVFATGSRPTILPIKGANADNVMGFRTLADVAKFDALPASSAVCVIGGGLLGLEAAVGLVKRGHQVSLVHRAEHILNRQLDQTAAKMLMKKLTVMGIRFYLGAAPVELVIDQQGNVSSVRLSSANEIPTSLIVMATGITPEISLAKCSGVKVGRAIEVNAQMETSDSDIYALGECCEFEGNTFGLVAPIWLQLDVLVANLQGEKQAFCLEANPVKLKVSGVNLFSVGEIEASSTSHCLRLQDEKLQHYRKLIVREGKLVGAILYGDVTDGSWYFELIQQQTNIINQLDQIIFGEAYTQLDMNKSRVA